MLPVGRYYRAGPMRLSRTQERFFAYPPRSIISFYGRGLSGRWNNLLFWTRDRLIDLSDTFGDDRDQFCMHIKTQSKKWTIWSDDRIKWIEGRIRYDLGFDGYKVAIRRLTTQRNHPCSEEFRWMLTLRVNLC